MNKRKKNHQRIRNNIKITFISAMIFGMSRHSAFYEGGQKKLQLISELKDKCAISEDKWLNS